MAGIYKSQKPFVDAEFCRIL